MILVGQYDSPFTHRVAVWLRVPGFASEHNTRSVFGDFDSMRAVNPLSRVPSLVLDDGTVLVDSAAILDWLDQTVGPERALVPPAWIERCRTQAQAAVAALAALPWPATDRLDQAQISTAVMVRDLRLVDPDLVPPGRHPALDALSERSEAWPESTATWPEAYVIPKGDEAPSPPAGRQRWR